MRTSLLKDLRVPLGPNDGDAAFEQHVLLATRVHRAARLWQRSSDSEGAGWGRFFADFFPSGRNNTADATLLWTDWRVGLVKDLAPRAGVALSHGEPRLHWQRDMHGALIMDLESMWDDFEHAVDEMVVTLDQDPTRRKTVLRRWCDRTWTVRPAQLVHLAPIIAGSGVKGRLPIGTTMGVTAVSAASASTTVTITKT